MARRQTFACRPDAEAVLEAFQATLKFTTLEEAAMEEISYYLKSSSFNNYVSMTRVSTSSLLNISLCRFDISVK